MTKLRQNRQTCVELSLKYTIGTLASLSGLSPHTIRAWERRYGALSPERTESNRRVYGLADLERLILLRRVVESGHSIGHVATLATPQLQALDTNLQAPPLAPSEHFQTDRPGVFLAACQAAVHRLDASRLEEALTRGAAVLGILALLDGVVIPLLGEIETRWLQGSLRISQEHMASAVLRTFLERVRGSLTGPTHAPRLLVTTPRNQHHEIGALMVAIVAAIKTWNVTYLGPNLPAGEIADAARQCGARAVALSLVFPQDDDTLAQEIRALRQFLGPSTPILVGGRAANSYAEALAEIDAETNEDLAGLSSALSRIAASPAG